MSDIHSIWQSLAAQAHQMAAQAFCDITTLEDWRQARPGRLRELLHGLGLDPLPARCELNLREMGRFSGEGFTARKLAFQILPDCWSAATIYHPASHTPDDPPLPGVLYVSGHAPLASHHYQYHPIFWARRGYACLLLETIEQADNPGEHHGFLLNQGERWLSLGYTPAGAEVWNAMRALDVLSADAMVDANRLGVTGVSGGGACSFFLAMVDERIKAVSTLCGVSTPQDAIGHRHVLGHCECFYPHNLHRRDLSEYAALIAPRPALFCFADQDPLFHPSETSALVQRVAHVYGLHGQPDACKLMTCPGVHGDHPPFDEATSRWFDDHVADQTRPMIARGERELSEAVTSVFNGRPPAPNHLHLLPELLSPQGSVPLPDGPADWPRIKQTAMATLRRCVPGLPEAGKVQAGFRCSGQWLWGQDLAVEAHRGTIGGQDVWLQLVRPGQARGRLVISVVNEDQNVTHGLGRIGQGVDRRVAGYGAFEPRMAGFIRAAGSVPSPPGSFLMPMHATLQRAMALVGTTPVMCTIEDLLALVDHLKQLDDFAQSDIYLHGRGEMATACLYAALLEDRIAGLLLEGLPASHREGSPILGVLRAMDVPQAVGLMAPRKVALIQPGHCFWTWPQRAYDRLGCASHYIKAGDVRGAADQIFA